MKTIYNLIEIFLIGVFTIFLLFEVAGLFKLSVGALCVCTPVLIVCGIAIKKLNDKVKALSGKGKEQSYTTVNRDKDGHITVTIDTESALRKAMSSPGKIDWKLRDQYYPTPGPWDFHEQEYPMMLSENYRVTYPTRAGGQYTVDCTMSDMISRNYLITKVLMPDTNDTADAELSRDNERT